MKNKDEKPGDETIKGGRNNKAMRKVKIKTRTRRNGKYEKRNEIK